MTPQEIWMEARYAADVAARDEDRRIDVPEQSRIECGFAWVTIRPARGPFVAHLKRANIGSRGGYDGGPGYGIWGGDLHSVSTQSFSVHAAAARAATEVLQRYGVDATFGGRLD